MFRKLSFVAIVPLLAVGPCWTSLVAEPLLQTSPALVLPDGTPLRIRINRTVSSADAKVGDNVDFELLDDIKVAGVLAIPKGSVAMATVTQAEKKKSMGRGGKLDVNMDYVRLVVGEKVSLRAVKENQGGGHVGAMTGAIVATSIVFFPAAPLFLLMKGKDITIPKGTEVTAYVNGDYTLADTVKPSVPSAAPSMQPPINNPNVTSVPPAVPPTQAPTNVASVLPATPSTQVPINNPNVASLVVTSSPDGADITIDGKFAGTTPSTLRLSAGDHTVLVEKGGFKQWNRAVTVTSGSSISLNVTLERPAPAVIQLTPNPR